MFNPVDWDKKLRSKAKAKGVKPEELQKEWNANKDKGIAIHKKIQEELEKEDDVVSYHTDFTGKGRVEEILNSLPDKDDKLENGKTYLERPVFSRKQGIWGFPDKIVVKRNTIHLEDIKTWKVMYRSSAVIKTPTGWSKEKFLKPLDHLDTCNYWDAVLQLSLYMHILWENNKNLKVGKLYINHITTNSKDVIIGREKIEVPYLREEIQNLLKYKKVNQL